MFAYALEMPKKRCSCLPIPLVRDLACITGDLLSCHSAHKPLFVKGIYALF